jgi:hypothetical protein
MSRLTPSLLVSTRATSLLRLDAYHAAADEAAFSGIDLDGVDELRRVAVSSRSLDRALAHDAIRSVWLQPAQLEGDALLPFAAPLRQADRRLLVVIDVPPGADRDGALRQQIAAANRIQNAAGHPLDLAVAVRAENPERSRAHLDRLVMIGHIAAEWDLKLALDLLPQPDVTWEAEAALVRLLPRLVMVRAAVPRSVLSGGTRWRMASRVMATLADAGYRQHLSLAPELSFWEKRSPVTIANRCATFAANVERRSMRRRIDGARRPGHRQFG